ncbi:MAG TPA: AAA family ATPase [Gammaproteobacteria bacterium]|nr:AAA family ATPase [Gammaproteobacteria bacterium]
MTDRHNLKLLIESHFPIVVLETHEEQRVVDLIKSLYGKKKRGLQVWTASEGLKNHLLTSTSGLSLKGGGNPHEYGVTQAEPTIDPDTMLDKVKKSIKDSIILLLDFHPYIDDPKTLRLVKEIAQQYYVNGNTLVFISHQITVPEEIERLCVSYHLSVPSQAEIFQIIVDEAKTWNAKNGNQTLKVDKKAVKLLAQNLLGLTTSDAKRFIRNAIYNDDAITHSDVTEVMEAKYKLVAKDSILSFDYDTVNFSNVGGFHALKDWLNKRKHFFLNADGNTQFDIPKGIMLLGVQGCGKSLAAKAVAGVWGIPLMRLDFGAIYDKYIGNTEKNIREALQSAESLSPCVLWVDEIEKGINSGDADSGTSGRVLGTLLTWMAENKSRVFVVATANDIQSLPPELVRKGRMDEIFFVDLPDVDSRKEILSLHIEKRDIRFDKINLDQVAVASEGFSGAELEQVVVSARYASHADGEQLNTEKILEEIRQTKPLSVVMDKHIGQLREWARDRTVSAN